MIFKFLKGPAFGYLLIGGASLVVFLAAGWKLSAIHNDYLSGKLKQVEQQLKAEKASTAALSEARAAEKRLRERRDAQLKRIEEAKANAPQEVRDCGDVVLPADLADGLRGDDP